LSRSLTNRVNPLSFLSCVILVSTMLVGFEEERLPPGRSVAG